MFFHLTALAAPFVWSWSGLVVCLVLAVLTGQLGITAGYHRLLVHRSFATPGPVRYFLALCGVLALQTGPLGWCALHRLHHQHPEGEADPHSPHRGFWWAHLLWFMYTHPDRVGTKWRLRFVPDLARDPGLRFLDRFFLPINLLVFAALLGIGYWVGGWPLGLSLLVWGGAVRVVLIWHATFLVNSATHLWGYRNYTTADDSRNNWCVAAVAFGEGWHNNHHADPRAARHGHRWFELDTTWMFIRCLEAVGLAWDVVRPDRRRTAHLTPVPPA
ncbi:MAG: fatty acid desaturase [Planctomycetes bacterium]|nr:fatty acid desaturase [Planctomycetota bacterium]